jgi:putative PIN family toxin of toxin-antitoxin system
MRVVIDTNIFISALIRPLGNPGKIIAHWRNGGFKLLYSDSLVDEWLAVLSRPRIRDKYHITDEDIKTILMLILQHGETVITDRKITACRDPKDNKFLEIAVAGQTDMIVTGDKDLLVLNPFENIPIVTPTNFLLRVSQDHSLDFWNNPYDDEDWNNANNE